VYPRRDSRDAFNDEEEDVLLGPLIVHHWQFDDLKAVMGGTDAAFAWT
jgi:hypothetical protein